MPTPNVPPRAIPGRERRQLEPGADDPDPEPCPPRADDHQRVARPGAEPGAEIQRRSDAHRRDPGGEQPDPNAERVVRESLRRLRRTCRAEQGFRRGRRSRPCRAHTRAEPPRTGEHDDADRDGGLAERERGVPADPLMEHVPRRETEPRLEQRDGPGREQRQPEQEDSQARATRPPRTWGVSRTDD